ncbi:MAG: hypothetical protein MJ213_01025 [Bacilli bacterium]|nr:hypothetical protein [Bacilli bacterium]
MIFLLDKTEKEKINKLIDTYHYNDEVANFLNANIINEDLMEEAIDDYDIQELDVNDYLEDKYYQNIKVKEVKEGAYQIKYEKYRPYQCFLFDDIEIDQDDYYLVKNKIGYFKEEFKYLTIQKDNVIWMSVIPHEINTMKKCAKNLSKHVYVLGLGLGYFPYLIASKVDKITIIEKDKNIINLFKKYIFPFFNQKEKYEIIEDDAISYLEKINKEDYIFIDLWHNVSDGFMTYYHLNKKLKNYPNVIHWISDSLLTAFRNIVINLIDEELNSKDQIDYTKASNEIDKITNNLHALLREKKISSYLEIKELLSNTSLKELMLKV